MNALNETLQGEVEQRDSGRELLFNMLETIQYGSLTLIAPGGHKYFFKGESGGVEASINIHDWSFCEDLILKGDIGLGESYISKKWDSNNIEKLIIFGVANKDNLEMFIKGSLWRIFFYRIKHLLNRNTKKGSKKNIHAHYDLGNDFYSLWLDSTMTYSSGIFHSPQESLENSQLMKYQRILDQLNLKPHDHILEIGCGWGGFLEYCAQRGVRVKGITISKEQYEFTKKRIQKYDGIVDVKLCDYRDELGKFDHVVSIEMFEALGEEYWNIYFKKIFSLLKINGKALIQTITINKNDFDSYRSGTDFIQQYIFPGGMLPSSEKFRDHSLKSGLMVLNEFEFGEDYRETLKRWESNFSIDQDKIVELGFDEKFIRTWRFYLKYCEGGFASKKIGVSQFTLSK